MCLKMNYTPERKAPLCKGSWIAVGKTEGMLSERKQYGTEI